MNKSIRLHFVFLSRVFCICVFCSWLGSSAVARAEPFKQVLQPVPFLEPRDHGAHYEYPTEWWYFTGHLQETSGNTYGFELTFFRIGVTASARVPGSFLPQSLFVAHFALTDDRGQRFFHAEKLERDTFSELAGAETARLHVWNGEWFARMDAGTINIQATTDELFLGLELIPTKPLVLHGESGFSKKGAAQGDASYYSSFTRMTGAGTIKLPDADRRSVTVQGAWMDHEVLSSKMGPDTSGWDWFALQLHSGEELMLYHLKDDEGAISPFSSGSYVRQDGTMLGLSREDFQITVIDTWKSNRTGIQYPSLWRITIPVLNKTFIIKPTVADQELVTTKTTGMTYWEGRSLVTDDSADSETVGNAYVELVGYTP
jgi:predicted secreted hydrolase